LSGVFLKLEKETKEISYENRKAIVGIFKNCLTMCGRFPFAIAYEI
jgi:hypothetical protein